ncbi:MAG: sulfatase-like hydrolase/transferase [Chitinophagaceae bacterium]|nr:sulfatase-like hydrolase/transferase [Chitinophagaceae bacterium]
MKSVAGKPVFLFLLPVFFFLHAYNENFAPGLGGAVLTQILLYTGAGLLLSVLLIPVTGNFRKAALGGFVLIALNFFFGALHDTARQILGRGHFLVRYSFIIVFLFILLALFLFCLRKTKRSTDHSYRFLHLLFGVLILWELVSLVPALLSLNKRNTRALSPSLQPCAPCSKPDIYAILTDEYAGEQQLKDIFSFDNTAFYQSLSERGFFIASNSISNYNATVHSMASFFNMEYLPLSGKGLVTQGNMLLCRDIIQHSNTGVFFKKMGYEYRNYSFFELEGEKKAVNNLYFHPRGRILTFGTFVNRFRFDAGFNFFSKSTADRLTRLTFLNDETTDSLTRLEALRTSPKPRFIYSHFSRPHHPYYVDRNGKPMVYNDSLPGFERIKNEYKEHLLYSNQRLLSLIDHILKNARKPPVILLASDHGFRQFDKEAPHQYYFMNLCAIHLPGTVQNPFYNGMSFVNTFRVILNKQFGQQLPMLKDSSTFLTEKALW